MPERLQELIQACAEAVKAENAAAVHLREVEKSLDSAREMARSAVDRAERAHNDLAEHIRSQVGERPDLWRLLPGLRLGEIVFPKAV